MVSEREFLAYVDGRLGLHSGRGPEYQWSCPFCIDRKGSESAGRKLWVNIHNGMAHCFRCEYKARSLESFFRAMNGGRLLEAERQLVSGTRLVGALVANVFNEALVLLNPERATKALKAVGLPAEAAPLSKNRRGLFARGYKYFVSRGGTDEMIEKFDVHYCPTGREANRLIFPVHMGGKIVYWADRYTGSHACKSMCPAKKDGYYTSAQVLLNYDNVVGKEVVSVVEGPFDCMGAVDAVATLGKGLSDAQVALLVELCAKGTREIVLLRDHNALENAAAAYRRLLGRAERVSIAYLDAGDPWDNRGQMHAVMSSRRGLDIVQLTAGRL